MSWRTFWIQHQIKIKLLVKYLRNLESSRWLRSSQIYGNLESSQNPLVFWPCIIFQNPILKIKLEISQMSADLGASQSFLGFDCAVFIHFPLSKRKFGTLIVISQMSGNLGNSQFHRFLTQSYFSTSHGGKEVGNFPRNFPFVWQF